MFFFCFVFFFVKINVCGLWEFFLENPEPFDEFRNQGRFGPQSFRPKSFWPILALIHFTDLFWTLEEDLWSNGCILSKSKPLVKSGVTKDTHCANKFFISDGWH